MVFNNIVNPCGFDIRFLKTLYDLLRFYALADYFSQTLSGPKHIVCHHCGAFGHLRPHCSKFYALKRINKKEELELLGSYTKNGKPDLSENSMLLKKVF